MAGYDLSFLTPEQQAEISAFDADAWAARESQYRNLISSRDAAALAAANATGVSNINYYVNPIGAAEIIPGSTARIMAGLGDYNPTYRAVMRTYGSENNKENPIDVTERSTFAVDPSASYRLVDNRTGKVVAQASNAQEVKGLVEMANAMSKEQGKKANWDLQQSTIAAGNVDEPIRQGWTAIAQDDPDTIPTSIKLIAAGMAAATGAGLLQLGGLAGIGSLPAATPAVAEVGSLAPAALASTAGNVAALNAAAQAGLAGAGLGAGVAATAPAIAAAAPAAIAEGAPIIVTAPAAASSAPLATAGLGAVAATPAFAATPAEDIVVTADSPVPEVGPLDVAGPTTGEILSGVAGVGSAAGGLSTLDKIRLGLLGTNLIGSVLGGGNVGGAGVTDTSRITSTPLNRTARDITFDPFTYGQAGGNQPGEFTFFSPYTMQGAPTAQPPATGLKEGGDVPIPGDGYTGDDLTSHLVQYHKTGGHHGPGPVRGLGSGQEDKIPAWLSDGEYVWSAQDVADLGDGSTNEGVRRLDKMREMVRRQAGRKDVKKIAKPQKGLGDLLKAAGGKV